MISIIIATYNSGKTLRVALQSVLEQTYQNWECIVVDGASKDDTIAIVKEFEIKDSRFRHISEPDRGIYDAFNKGWKMANGEWIHYLGSDDKLTQDGLRCLADNFGTADLLVGDTYIIKPWGDVITQKSHGYHGCHQSMITKRDVIEKLNGFNESYKFVADADLLIRLEKAGYKIKNVHSVVSYFTLGGASQKFSNRFFVDVELYKIHKINNAKKYPALFSLKLFIRDIFAYIKICIKKNNGKSN